MDSPALRRPAPPPGFSYDAETAAAPAAAAPPSIERPAPPPGFSYDEGAPAQAPKLQHPGRSFARAAGDLAVGVGEGLVSAGMAIPQLANTLTGGAVDRYVFKPATAAVDRVLGGPGEGRTLAEASQDTRDALDSLKSEDLRRRERELADTKGFLPSLKRIVTDPALLAQQVAEQVPQFITPAGATRKAGEIALERVAGAALAKGTAKRVAAGMSEDAARAAALPAAQRLGRRAAVKAGTAAAIGSEAAISGAQNSEQAQQEVMGMDQSVLDANPDYQALVQQGATPQAARETLAMRAGERAAAAAAAITAATGGLTGKLESRIFQGEVGHGAPLLSRPGLTELAKATGKEFTQEALQEGGEQLGQNYGVQSVDPSRSLMEGVPESAAIGGVVGGVAGGGMYAGSSALRSRLQHPRFAGAAPGSLSDAAKTIDAATGPLSRAAAAAPSTPTAAEPPAAAPQTSALQAAKAEWDATMRATANQGVNATRLAEEVAAKHGVSADDILHTPDVPAKPASSNRVDPGAPPWMDPVSGEIQAPTKDQLVQALADHIVRQHGATGDMRISTPAIAQAWGVPKGDVDRARNAATKLASNQVAAAERAAMQPAASPAQEPTDTGEPQLDQSSTTASVPVMITQAMKRELRTLGHTDGDIAKMTPQQAHDTLRAGEPVLQGARELTGEQGGPAVDQAVQEQQQASEDTRVPEADRSPEAAAQAGNSTTTAGEAAAQPAADAGGAPGATEPVAAGGTDLAGAGTDANAQPALSEPAAASAPAAAQHKVSGRARDAEGLRVKTPDGEINGRVHVDQLVAQGYNRVESVRAGDKMVHRLVNDAGESQPIKARQLPYAKEVTASAAQTPAPAADPIAARWDAMSADERTAVLRQPGGWGTGPNAKTALNPTGKRIAGKTWAANPELTQKTIARLLDAHDGGKAAKPATVRKSQTAATQAAVAGDPADEFTLYPVKVLEGLDDAGRAALFKQAGVRSMGAFDDLPISDRAKAYAKHVEAGGQRVAVPADYNAHVREQEQSSDLRRREEAGIIRSKDGSPFKTEAAARRELSAFPAAGEFARDRFGVAKAGDGFTIRRFSEDGLSVGAQHWTEADAAEAERRTANRRAAYMDQHGLEEDEFGNMAPVGSAAKAAEQDGQPIDVAIAKQEEPAVPAEHVESGATPVPATAAEVAKSATTAAKTVDMATARKELLRLVDQAIAKAPFEKELGEVTVSNPRSVRGQKTWELHIDRQLENGLQVPSLKIVDEKGGFAVRYGNHLLERYQTWSGAAFHAESAMRAATWSSKDGAAGTWDFTGEQPREYVNLDVPGDGSFKVLNTRERLQAFQKEVEAKFKKPSNRPPKPEGVNTAESRSLSLTDAKRQEILSQAEQIDAAAAEAATSPTNDTPEPTPAQIEAGNYKKGHISLQGLDISIENPRGSTRSGVGENGKAWSHVMSDHYGYIRRTEGADGEHVDVYVGPKPESGQAFVVDQLDQKTGEFDEHKAMLGFDTEAAAVKAYRSNFDKGWKVGPVHAMSMDEFKAWLKDGDNTSRPAGEHVAASANGTLRNFGWDAVKLSEYSYDELNTLRAQVERQHANPKDAKGHPLSNGRPTLHLYDKEGMRKLDALAWAVTYKLQESRAERERIAAEIAAGAPPPKAQAPVQRSPEPASLAPPPPASEPAKPIQMTMAEWKATHKDFKATINGQRTVMRGGRVVPVEIVKADSAATPSSTQTAIEQADAALDAARNGNGSLDDLRAAFERVRDNKAEVKAELSKLTKAELLKRFRMRDDTKERLVSQAYRDVLGDFTLSNTISYSMGGNLNDAHLAAVQKLVDGLTQADLDAYAERNKAAAARGEEIVSGLENPKTLEDFQRLSRLKGGEANLTPEQRETFDRLRVEATKEDRAREAARNTVVKAVDTAGTGMRLIETKHTRDGYDLFVVQPEARVERDVYDALNRAAKQLGGWYSSFRGNGATPGFQFKSRESAEKFMALREGDQSRADELANRDEQKREARAETLADKAAVLRERAEESLSKDRKDNTRRRAAQAASAEAEARANLAMANTMDRISEAQTEGTAGMLDQVRHRNQVQLLDRTLRNVAWVSDRDNGIRWEESKKKQITPDQLVNATLPGFAVTRDTMVPIVRELMRVQGGKQLGRELAKTIDYGDEYGQAVQENPGRFVVHKSTGDRAVFPTKKAAEAALARSTDSFRGVVVKMPGGGWAVALSPDLAIERKLWMPDSEKKVALNLATAEKLIKLLGTETFKSPIPYWFASHVEERARFASMGITKNFELREALRKYLALREEPAGEDRVRKLERAIQGNKSVGIDFFPTPPALASRLVDQADIGPGMRVLEPSAGKGDIADAIRDAADNVQVDTVEMSHNLREILEAKGHEVVGHDFNEFEPSEPYDRIVMNPPFSNGLDADHVQRAYGMLKPGGRLVAITGEGIFGRNDKKAAAFREWLDSVQGTSEKLPEGSFKSSFNPTGVNTRMVVIDKPEVDSARADAEDAAPAHSFSLDHEANVGGPFYSAALRAVEAGKGAPKKADAAGWKGWLDGAVRRGDMKQTEREWLGIDQWLGEQLGPVSREQLVEFVRDNQVQIRDVTLTNDAEPAPLPEGWTIEEDAAGGYVVLDAAGDERGFGFTPVQAKEDAQDPDERANPGETKYPEYTLPGGREYRELLLTLPELPASETPDLHLQERADGKWAWFANDEQISGAFLDRAAAERGRPNYVAPDRNNYRSKHFDSPNVLAHVRFNERTDAQGKRVLFLEEVQSDWHQQGRRHGYVQAKLWEVFDSKDGVPVARYATEQEAEAEAARRGRGFDYGKSQEPGEQAVPDAPMKGTNQWSMLAFRRMVAYAAEHGFDRIAWTTGEQQAQRYDLSKQIASIRLTDNSTGGLGKPNMEGPFREGMLTARGHDGREIIRQYVRDPAELPDLIGKEATDKLLALPGNAGSEAGINHRVRELSGLDLKLGGEGMRAFYDQMLPKEVAKWGRPFGAKVSTAELPTGEHTVRGEDIQPETFAAHSIDLTPAMREAALGGLPLFRQSETSGAAPATSTSEQRAHATRVRQVAELAMSQWKGDDKPGLRVVDTPEQLPAYAKRGPDGRPDDSYKRAAGMYDGRAIWIVASAHRLDREGMRRILTTMAHEGVGHYGVDRIVARELGADAWTQIESAIDRLRTNKATGSAAMRSVLESVESRYGAAGRRTFARETLAVMAERGVRNGLLDRVVTALRRWLRKVLPSLKLTEPELRQLLVKSKEYLERGTTYAERVQATQAMAFARDASAAPAAFRPDAADAERFRRDLRRTVASLRTNEPPIRVSAMPPVLRALGGRDVPIVVSRDVVRKATNGVKHDVPLSAIERLPEELHDPLAVFRSATQADSLVVLTEERDATNRPVIAALDLRMTDKSYDVTRIASVYGKSGDAPFQRWASEGLLAYKSDRAENSPVLKGLQLPNSVSGEVGPGKVLSESDVASTQGGPAVQDGLKPDFSLDDQTQTPAFKRWFGDSKVVDADGRPRVLYHGTARDITTFRRSRSGTFGDGIYLTADPEVAEMFADSYADDGGGQNIMPVYASIQRPYYADADFNAGDAVDLDSPAVPLVQDVLGEKAAAAIRRARNGNGNFGRAIRDKLEEMGHDGIIAKYGDGSEEFVVFHPSQIKSATGNAGTFDPFNPRIDFSLDDRGEQTDPNQPAKPFSRAAQSIGALQEGVPKQQESLLQAAKGWLTGKARDFEPAALGTLQLRHVLELMEDSKLFPAAKQYAARHQQMDADRQAQIDRGSELTQKWQSWAYEKGPAGWAGKLNPEAQSLARFIHDVTQLGIDPTDAYKKLLMTDSRGEHMPWTKDLIKERIQQLRQQMRSRPGDDKSAMIEEIKYLRSLPGRERVRQTKYPELVARWNALPDQAKAIFSMARDRYQELSDLTERALLDRIDALSVPETYKRSLRDRIRFQFEANRKEGVYFPLSRFGDYWVSGTQRDGQSVFGMFESYREAEQAIQRLRAAGVEIEAQGLKDNDYRAKNAPSGTFVSDVIGLLQKSGAPEKVQDEVYQLFLKTLPELSMRKHGIHRKNIAGFSDDALRAFAKNNFHSAHQIARLKHGFQMEAALEAMQEAFENQRNTGKLGGNTDMDLAQSVHGDALLGELKKRHDWIMSPKDSQMANVATSVGYLYYMSASPAAALVNLTQGAQVTLPVLGARHGWPKAMRALAVATKDAMRTAGNIQRVLKTDEERQAFAVLEAQGTFQRTATHTLAGIAEGNRLTANPTWARVMNAMGWLFHKAEVINREAAGVAAFRLARGEGQSFEQAVRYADEIVNGTHFDYSNANRARYMQGNVPKILFQFKNYSVGMSWVLYRNLYKAMKGETPEVRRLARRTLTGVLGMTGLFAGVMGMPIINLVRYVANAAHAAAGDDDEPWDFNTEFRSWLAEHLGEDVARWVADGAVSQVTGANIANRVSLADLWFRDADRELEGRDAYYNYLDAIAGPLGGIAKNMLVGSQMIGQGHVERGVETILPKFIKDAMKSLRYASEGSNTLRGDPIVADVSTPEALLQAIGFQPTSLREQQRINSALMNYQHQVQDRRQLLINAFAMAHIAGDTDGQSEALAKIRAFNGKFPEVAIRMSTLHASLRTRAQRTAEAAHGVFLQKRLAGRIRQEVGAMAGG